MNLTSYAQSRKRSGVEGLIEIVNPNRVSQKNKKVTELDIEAPRELSRRERLVSDNEENVYQTVLTILNSLTLVCVCSREEIEKQKSKERYMKLHLEGKTEQARADLARLAIIKKQREDAARKRDELRKGELTKRHADLCYRM